MNNSFKSLTPLQKRALLRIAIDLVKADNIIHSKEVFVLKRLQEDLSLPQEELDLVHYITLSNAVSVIGQMDKASIKEVLGTFNSIMKIDSDIDFEENLLYAAVTASCLPESRQWATVISVPEPDLDLSGRQIVYLEKSYSEGAHRVLDDRYDNLLISKAFGDIGLHLFYLPGVLEELGLVGKDSNGKFGLLQKSMGYLMPAGDMIKVEGLKELLGSFDSETFFKVVVSRFGLSPAVFPFQAFLLIKIQTGVVLDDENAMRHSMDFFCLDISSDVKHRILSFVSLFGDSSYLLPYEGYYRILFDYFSSESKMNSEICLDRNFHFTLPSCGGRQIRFESSPQARTFYLLLLRFGQEGISQEAFNVAVGYLDSPDVQTFVHDNDFDLDGFLNHLRNGEEAWKSVILHTIQIYRSISSKDEHLPRFLSYIASILSHRSSLKSYLNHGFDSIQELSDKHMYHVLFDKATNTYRVGIGISMFLIDERNGTPVALSESRFWQSLR